MNRSLSLSSRCLPALVCAACLLSGSLARAETSAYDEVQAKLEKTNAQWKTQAEGNPDVLVLDFVRADRKAQKVDLLGSATGVSDEDPVEFFLATLDSGKDYESLVITWAKPSDVHKALEFIGVKPGRPVNYATNHHWSRGPRIAMTVDGGAGPVRIEDMVVDTDTGKPLARQGLIFAGSFTHTDEQGKAHYAADEVDSKAIAPNYNDPVAVFDVPRRASQAAVYGFQKPNDKHTMKQGTPVTITLKPAKGDEAVTSHDLVIVIKPGDDKPAYELREGDKKLADAPSLAHLVNALAQQVDRKSDLFTTVSVDPAIPVTEVRKLYAVLMSIEADRAVKLDPPPATELFHRAFFPDETWREREGRLGEPWELFLDRKDGKLVPRLERQVEIYEGAAEPKIELQKYDVKTPEEFVKTLNQNESQWSKSVFIYPPADATYGELMVWARPALPTYPRVFVFPAPRRAPTQPE